MKYILYWIVSYTVTVSCPPTIDPVTQEPAMNQNLVACIEHIEKEVSKEFDTYEQMTAFKDYFLVQDGRVVDIWCDSINFNAKTCDTIKSASFLLFDLTVDDDIGSLKIESN